MGIIIKDGVYYGMGGGSSANLFPDYTKVIREFTTQSDSWVATEDCCLVGQVNQDVNKNTASVYIDDEIVCCTYSDAATVMLGSIFAYVKKGQTVTTNNKGSYVFKAYALQAGSQASGVGYDNSESGLEATTMQGAIDEINSNLSELTPKDGNYYGTVILNKNAAKHGVLVPMDLSIIKNYDITASQLGVMGINVYTISVFDIYENCVIAYTDGDISNYLGTLGIITLSFTKKSN